jgi:hypothetical protein
MTAYYASLYCSPKLAHGVAEAAQAFYEQAREDGHQHLHIVLQRTKPYAADGRYQNEEQALAMDRSLQAMLDSFKVPIIEAKPEEESLTATLKLCQRLRDIFPIKIGDGQNLG